MNIFENYNFNEENSISHEVETGNEIYDLLCEQGRNLEKISNNVLRVQVSILTWNVKYGADETYNKYVFDASNTSGKILRLFDVVVYPDCDSRIQINYVDDFSKEQSTYKIDSHKKRLLNELENIMKSDIMKNKINYLFYKSRSEQIPYEKNKIL